MKILYIWDSEYPWDVRTQKICLALARAGHAVHITARNRSGAPLRETLPEGEVHRMARWPLLDAVSSFPAFFNPRWLRLLSRAASAAAPDVIIVRDLPLCPSAIRVGRRRGVPVVLDMAENYPAMIRAVWNAGRHRLTDILVRNPRLVRMVERYCLPRVDHVVTVVEESRDRVVADGVPSDHVSVVSNTPPRDRVSQFQHRSFDGRNGRLELAYLGLMEIPRGVGDLLQAVDRLRSRGTEVRLRLLGDGRDKQLLQRQAAELGLTEREVEFLGYVPNIKALEIIAEADVGIVPHHADEAWNTTIPNKLFDYMAAGLPVVSSDAVPCRRVLEETGAGEVFRSEDAEDLAAAIARLSEPAARERRGSAGRRAILERYNWEDDVAVLTRVLEQLPTTKGN